MENSEPCSEKYSLNTNRMIYSKQVSWCKIIHSRQSIGNHDVSLTCVCVYCLGTYSLAAHVYSPVCVYRYHVGITLCMCMPGQLLFIIVCTMCVCVNVCAAQNIHASWSGSMGVFSGECDVMQYSQSLRVR